MMQATLPAGTLPETVSAPAPESARQRQVRHLHQWRRQAAALVAELPDVPPFPLRRLLEVARALAQRIDVHDAEEVKLLAVLIHNEAWQDTVAAVPFERRLLLLPQCLRARETCPAARDAFGLLCEDCGRCPIGALQREATALGYAVLVAEGSEGAAGMLREGLLDAVVGVSCLSALEKTFPRIVEEALPALAVPLLRDGCDRTDVDAAMLRELLRLRRTDAVPPGLNTDVLRADVRRWFEPEALRDLLRFGTSPAAETALACLAGAGKRWRPLLAASVAQALRDGAPGADALPVRAVAVASECFHKASLIHDDIEDGDVLRDGAPTLHRTHGIPVALNVGDLLIGAGYRLLADCPLDEAARVRMLSVAARAHCDLCVGQGQELHDRGRADLPVAADLLRLFELKTAPAFEVALLLGAIAGGADAATCATLSDFSRTLGVAYQIDDDWQDFARDAAKQRGAGRPASLPLALLAEACTAAERRALEDGLRTPDPAVAARLAALAARHDLAAAVAALRTDYHARALDSLAPLRSIRLKSVLMRLVKRILPQREGPDDAAGGPPA